MVRRYTLFWKKQNNLQYIFHFFCSTAFFSVSLHHKNLYFMNRRVATFIAAACLAAGHANAQYSNEGMQFKAFNQIDLGVSLGTTGYGLELSTPIASFAKVRTGFHYVPRIEVPMHFGIQVGNDPEKSQTKFEKMQGLLESFTGRKIDSQIDIIGKPANFWNWNVLVDIYPLKNNKHWHITGGFYLGPSHIAKAYNTTEDMPSLMAVGIYNNLYDKLINDRTEAFPDLLYEANIFDFKSLGINASTSPNDLETIQRKFRNNGRMGVHVGEYTHDVYYDEDVVVQLEAPMYDERDRPILDADGNQMMEVVDTKVVHKKGDVKYAKGDPYMLEPDENSMVKCDMHVNRFKPYLGFGYEGRLAKNDDRYKIAFDCGVLFWGGVPEVTTHEGIDLTSDVENIKGKVGTYVDAIEKFKVFPVVTVRFTRRF